MRHYNWHCLVCMHWRPNICSEQGWATYRDWTSSWWRPCAGFIIKTRGGEQIKKRDAARSAGMILTCLASHSSREAIKGSFPILLSTCINYTIGSFTKASQKWDGTKTASRYFWTQLPQTSSECKLMPRCWMLHPSRVLAPKQNIWADA